MASAQFPGISGGIFGVQLAGIAFIALGVGAFPLHFARHGTRPEQVVVTLVNHDRILALQRKSLHRTEYELQDIVLGKILPELLHQVDIGDRRIDGRSVLIQRVVLVVGADDRRKVNGSVPVIGSADIRLVEIEFLEGIAHSERYPHPLRDIVIQVETPVDLRDAAVLDDTFGVIVRE